ncbi:hypothetical protein C5167_025559 [Papaver somniferum]|uniref:Uncharacterized protein n=1 Tax=Papaver somniferum TaxID=3469 RepID=A0A4Y7JSU6_PAPSO|nr:uncharacterized protein LOC113284268 isoform X2 [Papaver somniferum]RZC63787.1 hypothetical protein C5167_025559 [Papaver somniferum]
MRLLRRFGIQIRSQCLSQSHLGGHQGFKTLLKCKTHINKEVHQGNYVLWIFWMKWRVKVVEIVPLQHKGSSQPSQETFNHDYWFNRIQGSTAHNATQGSTVDNDVNESEDEDIVHLENKSEDECNPVEDPYAPAIFDSYSENEIGYDEYVETYKVPVHNEESSSSEDGSCAEVEDKNDGGPEIVIDKAFGKPVWHKRYLPDMTTLERKKIQIYSLKKMKYQ